MAWLAFGFRGGVCVRLAAGLGWVLRSPGLGDAAAAAQLVSLAPLVAGVVVWAWRRSAAVDGAAATRMRNELSGGVCGSVVQAGTVHEVHIHACRGVATAPIAPRRGLVAGFVARAGSPVITVEVWITAALVVPICRSARCVWER